MRRGGLPGWKGRVLLALGLLLVAAAAVREQESLPLAAFPAVDKIVEAAPPALTRRRPDVAIEVVSRRFADHHMALGTAWSTAFDLLDVRQRKLDAKVSALPNEWSEDFKRGTLGLTTAIARWSNFNGSLIVLSSRLPVSGRTAGAVE